MIRGAAVKALSVHLPSKVLDNAELVRQFGVWTENKIYGKTGIERRHVVENELVSDLATAAGERLFEEHGIDRSEVDFLLLCTECPDHFLPATACVVQDRLGLSRDAGALDYGLGCTGFVYGLALAKGLVLGGVARKVLLITADTISRTIHPQDKSTRTLFGDAGVATLVEGSERAGIGEFSLGTDGGGASKLLIPAGAWARPSSPETRVESVNRWGNVRTPENLYMEGPEIMKFSLAVAPPCMEEALEKNGLSLDEVDLVVVHQASRLILNALREKLGISEEKFVIHIERYGNTAASSIPLTLYDMQKEGRLKKGNNVLLLAFGVGLSWGGTVVRW